MSDADIINSALEKHTKNSFVPVDQQSIEIAVAAMNYLDYQKVGPAGSVGCLKRTEGFVLGFSSLLAREIEAGFQSRSQAAKTLAFGISGLVKFAQPRQLFFAFDIAKPIQDAMGTEKCAEKYIYSSRGGSVPIGMAVIWYGGQPNYKPDAFASREFVPVKYEVVSCERFQYMKPCDDCCRISLTMMQYASG